MLNFYNSLSRKKEEFKSINPGKVGMYVCGPTVYDYIHIGNIRAYLMADTIRRCLEYKGYEVRMIKNITDVGHLTQDDIAQADTGEDKILNKALAEKKTPEEIARFYEENFKEVEAEMNILPAHFFPRATAHIQQIIRIISGLIEKGYAYEKNGNAFFDVTKFKDYGKLSGNTLEKLKVGARLEEHPDKKHPWDFALWLKADASHLLQWDSPWSRGYPGWHIECSAMSGEYLGDSFDIHTGGEDNIFPHHEAEIAQSECFSGKKFVNYWIHTRHLLVDNEKMSKSKGNFYTLPDIKEKGFNPMVLRLLIISSQHRSSMNFTWDSMNQAKENLQRITDFINNLKDIIHLEAKLPSDESYEGYQERFNEALDDDLNTPLALSVLYDLITETNKLIAENKLGTDGATKILGLWEKMNKVFGLVISNEKIAVPAEIKKLATDREGARKIKDFEKADELRKAIEKQGYTIKDTSRGTEIKKL